MTKLSTGLGLFLYPAQAEVSAVMASPGDTGLAAAHTEPALSMGTAAHLLDRFLAAGRLVGIPDHTSDRNPVAAGHVAS